MIRFNCDYLEGAHPAIMEKLMATNFEQTPGYGEDVYCEQARELIREKCGVLHQVTGLYETYNDVHSPLP